jgi:capsular exopolysaccharide synthesis family protein
MHETGLAPFGIGDLALQRRLSTSPATGGRNFAQALWHRRVMIVVLTALSLIPALLYVQFATPRYTSTSTLLIRRSVAESPALRPDPAGDSSGNTISGTAPTTTDSAASQPIPSDSSPTAVLAEQRAVITSTPVLAEALSMPGVAECDPIRGHRDPIETLRRAVSIETSGDDLLNVEASSKDPSEASCICAAVVQAYSEFLSSTRRNGNKDAEAHLNAAKAAAQADLAKASADLTQFAEDRHVGAGQDSSGANNAELESLAEEVSEAHVATVAAKEADDQLERELAKDSQRAQSLKWFEASSTTAQGFEADDEELIRSELLSLKARQAELEQKFMPGHPELVRLEKRIADLNLEHDAAIQRRAAAAAQREADLRHAYEDEQKRVLHESEDQADFAHRQNQVAQLQNRVDDLTQRINNLEDAPSDLPTMSVLEPARPPAFPSSPDRRRILPLAAGIGFVLSCLLAGWVERNRTIVLTSSAIGLNLPILAEIPTLPVDFGPIDQGQRLHANGSPALREIFSGLSTVMNGARSRGRAAITLITSPGREDGKSTLASNLAISVAQGGNRVLLVDANLRDGVLATMFGVDNATGLATLLEADVSIPITAIHHTASPSLDLVPSGPLPHNPAELLNSQRFIDLLGDLSERYDHVVIDSPPSVTFTDSRIISASADLTILVVRSDQINRRMFELAMEGLNSVGANVCGMVLNSGLDEERSAHIFESASRPAPSMAAELAEKGGLTGAIFSAALAVDLLRAPGMPSRTLSLEHSNGVPPSPAEQASN